VRPDNPLYSILLGLLIAGLVAVSARLLFFQKLSIKDVLLVAFAIGFCIWQLRNYFRNETVMLGTLPLSSAKIDSSKENREWRLIAAWLYVITYMLIIWAAT
jgi:hypothetical protein